MNKRGFVLMTMCAIGFLIAIIVFYQSIGVQMPGKTVYLGEAEVSLYQAYSQGEEMLFFIDTLALHAIEKAKTADDVELEFSRIFGVYVELFNAFYNQEIELDDYSFIISDNEVIGITNQFLILESSQIEYKVHPNFRISYESEPVTQPLI